MRLQSYDAEPRVTVPVTMPASWLKRLNQLAIEGKMTRSSLVRRALAAHCEMPNPTDALKAMGENR